MQARQERSHNADIRHSRSNFRKSWISSVVPANEKKASETRAARGQARSILHRCKTSLWIQYRSAAEQLEAKATDATDQLTHTTHTHSHTCLLYTSPSPRD